MHPSNLGTGLTMDFGPTASSGSEVLLNDEYVKRIREREKIQLYGYVVNNPVNLVDPSGLAGVICTIYLIGGHWGKPLTVINHLQDRPLLRKTIYRIGIVGCDSQGAYDTIREEKEVRLLEGVNLDKKLIRTSQAVNKFINMVKEAIRQAPNMCGKKRTDGLECEKIVVQVECAAELERALKVADRRKCKNKIYECRSGKWDK